MILTSRETKEHLTHLASRRPLQRDSLAGPPPVRKRSAGMLNRTARVAQAIVLGASAIRPQPRAFLNSSLCGPGPVWVSIPRKFLTANILGGEMPRRTDIAGIHPHRRVGGPLLHKRFEAKSSGGLSTYTAFMHPAARAAAANSRRSALAAARCLDDPMPRIYRTGMIG